VHQNFDRIVYQERAKLQEELGKLQQEQGEASTSTAPESAAITAPSFDCNYKTFHSSFRTLFRQDLSHELRTISINRLQDNLQNASKYNIDYSLQVYKTILLFKNHTLYIDTNSSIVMNTLEGFPLQEILPNVFDFKNTEKRVAPPIPTNSINSGTFTKHFKTLFNINRLQLIQSI
jgi:hypothetical protein